MPEAGRRVKCSETHQHFASHLLSSHADSLHRASDSTHIYLPLFSSVYSSCCDPVWKVISVRDPLPARLSALHIKSAVLTTSSPSHLQLQSTSNRQASLACHRSVVWFWSHSLSIRSTESQKTNPDTSSLKLIPHAWVLFNINSIQYR